MGIFYQMNRLFMQLPRQAVSWVTFLNVFDNLFWLTLLAITVALTLIFYIIFLFVNKEETITIGTSFATVYLSLMALSIPVEGRRLPSRCLILSVSLTGALVYWAYNAGLVSLLTVEHFNLPVRSLNDIVANPSYKVVLQSGTAYVNYFKLATAKTNPNAAIIWTRIQNEEEQSLFLDPKTIEQKLLEDSKLVYFGQEFQTTLQFSSIPCNIVPTSKPYFQVSVSLAFPKGSPYVSLFNYAINNIRQTGQVDRITKSAQLLKPPPSCTVLGGTSSFKPIQYENIFTAFLLLGAGILVAALSLYIERVSFQDYLMAQGGGRWNIFKPRQIETGVEAIPRRKEWLIET